MTTPAYRPLREHPHATLTAVNVVVEELPEHRDAIPPELYIKLDTSTPTLPPRSRTPPRRLRPAKRM